MVDLNFDVLQQICGLLTDVSDVLSISLASHFLRDIAIDRRLSMRPVTINGARSIHDLHNFVCMDRERRGPSIRAITIPCQERSPDSSEELLGRLLVIFESAPHVRTLSLHVLDPLAYISNPPNLLFRHPRFLATVANMASLQHLGVVAPTFIAADLLGSTRPALQTFRQCAAQGIPSVSSLQVEAAPQLASMLQEVMLNFDFFVAAARTSRTQALPAVKSCTLTNVSDLCGLDLLLRLFPNLDRNLTFRAYVYHVLDNDARLETVRDKKNQEVARKALTWRKLDHMGGLPCVLFALGLALPIRRLTLDIERESTSHWLQASGLSRVRTILQDCAPTHLALVNIQLIRQEGSILNNSLFHEAVVERLTHLVLDATYRRGIAADFEPVDDAGESESQPSSWDLVLDMLLKGLKFPALTHIRLIIRHEPSLWQAFLPTYTIEFAISTALSRRFPASFRRSLVSL